MSKQKTPPVPPTVLVITLNADGSGSLLARRGELAHLSQFTYSGLAEIVTAIQDSASALIEVEQHPPVINVPPSATATIQPPVAENIQSEEVTTDEPTEMATADNASPDTQNTLF
jgi:hypothetical protein